MNILRNLIIKFASIRLSDELTKYECADKQLDTMMDMLNNTNNPNENSIETLEIALKNSENYVSEFENSSCATIETNDSFNTFIESILLPAWFFLFSLNIDNNDPKKVKHIAIALTTFVICFTTQSVASKFLLEGHRSKLNNKLKECQNKFSEIRHVYENEVFRFTIIREMNLIKEELLKEINKHEQK